MVKSVKISGWPGYEDFEAEEIGRLTGFDDTEFVIVLDGEGNIYPIPARYVKED